MLIYMLLILRWLTVSQSLQVVLVLLGTFLYKRIMKAIRMNEVDRMGIRGFSNGMSNSNDYLDRSYKQEAKWDEKKLFVFSWFNRAKPEHENFRKNQKEKVPFSTFIFVEWAECVSTYLLLGWAFKRLLLLFMSECILIHYIFFLLM